MKSREGAGFFVIDSIQITTFQNMFWGVPLGKWPRSFAATATPCVSRTFRKCHTAEAGSLVSSLVFPEIWFILSKQYRRSIFPGVRILHIRGSAIVNPSHSRLVTLFPDGTPRFLPTWNRNLPLSKKRYVIVHCPRNGDSECQALPAFELEEGCLGPINACLSPKCRMIRFPSDFYFYWIEAGSQIFQAKPRTELDIH